jgi:protein-S-isoprenylcysteine O-methyltransferase Ste14
MVGKEGNAMWLLGGAVLITVWLAAWCFVRIRYEYLNRQELSTQSVFLVWGLYLFHLGVTMAASVMAIWFIPLPPIISWGGGIVLLGSGTVIFVASIWTFHSFKRMSGLDSSKLITSGIYRWSRNPQNLGWLLFLLGVSFLGRSGLAFLLTGLFWGLFVMYVPLEEQYLESVFGGKYRRYKQWSHRYFGPPNA